MSDHRTPPARIPHAPHRVSTRAAHGFRSVSVKVREAVPGDYPTIVSMLYALADHVESGTKPKVTLEVLERDGPTGHRNFQILVAEFEGKICGMCLYTLAFSAWRGMSGLFVEDIYVDPSTRGQGIGKKLLFTALEREKHRGAGYLKLEVALDNELAIGFYERLGFETLAGEGLMGLQPATLPPATHDD